MQTIKITDHYTSSQGTSYKEESSFVVVDVDNGEQLNTDYCIGAPSAETIEYLERLDIKLDYQCRNI